MTEEATIVDLPEEPVVEKKPKKAPLPAPLQAVVDSVKASPQDRAKQVRHYFAAMGWPDDEHPGTVRDFLLEYNIPVIDSSVGNAPLDDGQKEN